MRAQALAHAISLAKATDTPFAKACTKAVEVGVIVPSLLKLALKELGLAVEEKPGAKHGSWVKVLTSDGLMVAQAFSHDAADALLQAVAAKLKEDAKV